MKQEKHTAQKSAKIFPNISLLSNLSFIIIKIPMKAKIIITNVLTEILSFKTITPRIVVRKGIKLKVNNVFAIVVFEKDKINSRCATIRNRAPKIPIPPTFLILKNNLNLYLWKRTIETEETNPNDLKKDFIMTSNLDNSALLGAGVTAIYS